MKIGFFVKNSMFSNLDCSHLECGNPGIGGTPYLIVLIASLLSSRDNGLDVTLYVEKEGIFPDYLKTVVVKDAIGAIEESDKSMDDYIVVNSRNVSWDKFDFSKIKNKLKIVPWCHNFNSHNWNNIFSKEDRIARFVAVGREQLDLLRDHPVFYKGDYIYDCVPADPQIVAKGKEIPFRERKRDVVFLGSLHWGKSFHVLASIWPEIRRRVPDAELYVVGGGNLYGNNVKMGKYGLASEKYEDEFIRYLLNGKDEISPEVHFMGVMGVEKFDVLKKAKVAVPNPTGIGETFCLSAVEMQLSGCVLTAMESPGYYDTIYNGVLVKNKKQLTDSIVDLLLSDSPVKRLDETVKYITDNFSIESVLSDWERFFSAGMQNPIHDITPLRNGAFSFKSLKERLRLLKAKGLLPKGLVNVDAFVSLYKRLKNRVDMWRYS